MIRALEWIEDHLYFVGHTGRQIRLAYADNLLEPWSIYPPGSLQLEQSCFLTKPPKVTAEQFSQFEARFRQCGVAISHASSPRFPTPRDHSGQIQQLFFSNLLDASKAIR